MRHIRISDITVRACTEDAGRALTFKEKLETVKLLDRVGVSVIELGRVTAQLTDVLLIKSVVGQVKDAVVAVCPAPDAVRPVWEALKGAVKPRLQVAAATSIARMEYVSHMKPADVQASAAASVAACRALCEDVEFIAEDATRAAFPFLCGIISAALEAGATTVTVCDTAGVMLPEEFGAFLKKLREAVPALSSASLGVRTADTLHLSDALAVSAVAAGADEVKTGALPVGCASLEAVASILAARGDALDACTDIRMTELSRVLSGIERTCSAQKTDKSPFEDGVRDQTDNDDVTFTASDSEEEIMKGVSYLGYDLDPADRARVLKAFRRIAARKERVGLGELDVIIAAEAMQVPAAYTVESYVVTTGNTLDVVAHVKLRRGDEVFDGLSMGDGPIDAAFLAIEKITGHHYELDDFQLKAITEGREAMGQTVVKLRSGGRVYAGRGISTDIIGSGIAAYINALNRIVYEEENA